MAQVVAPRDTIKPRRDSIRVDTLEYWNDSLFNLPRQKALKDGAVVKAPKPRRKIRKFKIQYSDRIQYDILADWPMTSAAGVPTVLTLQKQLTRWEDSLLPVKWRGDTTRAERTVSYLYRFAKIWLIDAPIESLLMAAEQDFFGSMARTREFGLNGTSYQFSAPYPLPFWKPQGVITFNRDFVENEASRQELAQINSAVLDAGNMASDQLSLRWMQRKSVNYREALHFLRIQMAGLGGVISASNTPQPGTSAVENYLYYINRQYGHISSYGYTATQMRKDYSLAMFTNPNLYTSLYSVFYTYLIQGQDSMNTPAIRFGYGKYVLPWMQYSFTPFGAEWVPSLTVTNHRQMVQLYGRVGTDQFAQSYGGGFKLYNIKRSTNFQLDAHVGIWKQRYFFRDWIQQQSEPISWGGAAVLSGHVLLTKSWQHPMSLAFKAGYKTRGYMEGEVWDASPIIKLGVSFALDRDYVQDDTVPEYFTPERRSDKKKSKKKSSKRRRR